jgi:hypothetical protein
MMKRALIGAMCLTALCACDFPGMGSSSEGRARATPGEATELVDTMAAHNRLPQRDYVCTLVGPNPEADTPYGTVGINADTFTMVIKQEGRREGTLQVSDNRQIEVEGDLAVLDGEVRRITRARANSEGSTVELAFDFAPSGPDGHNRIVCRAEA